MVHRELLINGVFLGGPCDTSIGKELSRSPWDGSVVGTWAEAGPGEVEAAVDAASTAFLTWCHSSPESRGDLLLRIAGLIQERKEDLAQLMAAEIGKPIVQARGELDRAAITFGLAANHVGTPPESVDIAADARSKDYSCEVDWVPRGPVFAITPYNWPFNLGAHKIAPALAAGCTLVLKGSDQAALCTLELARLIHEAGCPPGVLNAIQCPPRLAEKIALDPRMKVISFTGSPGVGWHIKGLVPEKHVVLELGGTAPVIITPSADLDRATRETAISGNAYAGQVCISAQNVFVHASRFEEAKRALMQEVQDLKCGNPTDAATVVGPVISEAAADRILKAILQAEHDGWEILVRPTRTKNLLTPTLLAWTPQSKPTPAEDEEIFGPVLTIQPYDSLAELTQSINSTPWGIHASIYSSDEAEIQHLMSDLEMSGIIVNGPPTLRFDNMPYGGVKRSGVGREGGRYAYTDYLEPKVVVRKS